jgi:hypothetical protein
VIAVNEYWHNTSFRILSLCLLMICFCDKINANPIDSTDFVPDSTLEQRSDSAEVKPLINYIKIPDHDTLIHNQLFPYIIPNRITNQRIPNSIRDITKPYSGFYSLKSGPYGQSSVIIHDGLPVNNYILGDFVFDYRQLNLPVNGLTDSRLISPADVEMIRSTRLSDSRNFNNITLVNPPPLDSGALTSVYMQKGDYGFSNTMVRFAAAPGSRTRFGFSGGFNQSNSYLENTKKDMENYRLYTIYQLSDNYQLQQDMIFFSGDDQIRFNNNGFDYRGGSALSWWGISLAVAASDKVKLFERAAFIYQHYTESVRNSDHPKYRQFSELYKLKFDSKIHWNSFDNLINIEPYMKRVTFDPGGNSYAGISLNDFSTYSLSNKTKIYLSAATNISEFSDTDISLTFGFNQKLCGHLFIGGQVYRMSEKPSDFNLFATSQGLTRNSTLSINYFFDGNNDLGNTDYFGYRISASGKYYGINLEAYTRHEKIEDFHWWENYTATDTTYGSRPISRDMNLIAGGVDLTTTLPFDLDTRLAYSYSRLQDSDNDQYLTMSPRHKIYSSFIRNLYISRFDLHVLLNLEGEYHSANYINYYIPLELDANFFLNFKLQLKIKSLTFYYKMDNVLDEPYTSNDGYELGRGVWWGFLWNFIN